MVGRIKLSAVWQYQADLVKVVAGIVILCSKANLNAGNYRINWHASTQPAHNGQLGIGTATTAAAACAVSVSAASGTKGDFFNSAAAGRVRLPASMARWERDEYSTSSNDVAVLRVESGSVV